MGAGNSFLLAAYCLTWLRLENDHCFPPQRLGQFHARDGNAGFAAMCC